MTEIELSALSKQCLDKRIARCLNATINSISFAPPSVVSQVNYYTVNDGYIVSKRRHLGMGNLYVFVWWSFHEKQTEE